LDERRFTERFDVSPVVLGLLEIEGAIDKVEMAEPLREVLEMTARTALEDRLQDVSPLDVTLVGLEGVLWGNYKRAPLLGVEQRSGALGDWTYGRQHQSIDPSRETSAQVSRFQITP
jgi:hypothetical protein